jgi:hypothetical protein
VLLLDPGSGINISWLVVLLIFFSLAVHLEKSAIKMAEKVAINGDHLEK